MPRSGNAPGARMQDSSFSGEQRARADVPSPAGAAFLGQCPTRGLLLRSQGTQKNRIQRGLAAEPRVLDQPAAMKGRRTTRSQPHPSPLPFAPGRADQRRDPLASGCTRLAGGKQNCNTWGLLEAPNSVFEQERNQSRGASLFSWT